VTRSNVLDQRQVQQPQQRHHAALRVQVRDAAAAARVVGLWRRWCMRGACVWERAGGALHGRCCGGAGLGSVCGAQAALGCATHTHTHTHTQHTHREGGYTGLKTSTRQHLHEAQVQRARPVGRVGERALAALLVEAGDGTQRHLCACVLCGAAVWRWRRGVGSSARVAHSWRARQARCAGVGCAARKNTHNPDTHARRRASLTCLCALSASRYASSVSRGMGPMGSTTCARAPCARWCW
jgi:hypothetical protein